MRLDLLHATQRLQARELGHVHVHQQQVNFLAADDRERLLAVAGQKRAEALRLEHALQRLAEVAIVVGDQQRWNGGVHVIESARTTRGAQWTRSSTRAIGIPIPGEAVLPDACLNCNLCSGNILYHASRLEKDKLGKLGELTPADCAFALPIRQALRAGFRRAGIRTRRCARRRKLPLRQCQTQGRRSSRNPLVKSWAAFPGLTSCSLTCNRQTPSLAPG